MTSTTCWQKCWGAWGHHPNEVPAGWPWHGSCLSCTADRNVHWTASVTAPKSSFSLDLSLMLLSIDFICIGSLFDRKQLVGLHCHHGHLKGAVVHTDSTFPLCFDNFIVTPIHSLSAFINLCHLGHLSKALSSKSARGLHLLTKLLAGGLDCCLLCVWAEEAIPSHQLLIRVDSACPWLTVWVGLLDALVNFVFTDVPDSVSVMVSSAPQGLYSQPIIRISGTLGSSRAEFNELRPRVVRAVASSWIVSIVRLRLGR